MAVGIQTISLALCITAFSVAHVAAEPIAPARPKFEVHTVLAPAGPVAGYAVPTMTVTPQGAVLLFSVAKVGHVQDAGVESFCVMRRSTDKGLTWEPPRTVPEEGVAGELWQGVADEDTGDVFALTFSRPVLDLQGRPMSETWMIEHPQELRVLGGRTLLYRSSDGGATWSKPDDLTANLWTYPGAGLAWNIGHGIQLRHGPYQGRLLFPARYFGVNGNGVTADAHNTVIYSDDHGKTWRFGGHTQGYTGEGAIAELPDGAVYYNSRNHHPDHRNVRAWAVSRDGGVTFTDTGYDDQLIEPVCHAGVTTYYNDKGEHLLLFLNPSDPKERKRLTVRLSRDGGKTWPVSRVVWQGSAGYSDIVVMPDGRVLCAFETSEDIFPRGTIMVASFHMDWLLEQDQ